MGRFQRVTIRHIPREQNSRADRLCNEALDGMCSSPTGSVAQARRRPAKSASREEAVREEAVLCLKAAAACWARGQADAPSAEDVWSQLWSILEENGVLASSRRKG
jgi:hypothetical protein